MNLKILTLFSICQIIVAQYEIRSPNFDENTFEEKRLYFMLKNLEGQIEQQMRDDPNRFMIKRFGVSSIPGNKAIFQEIRKLEGMLYRENPMKGNLGLKSNVPRIPPKKIKTGGETALRNAYFMPQAGFPVRGAPLRDRPFSGGAPLK